MPIRKLENFHILLWLIKDLSWLMEFKLFGMMMVAPAIGFAGYIAYRSRKDFFQFSHNIAVVFWIIANSCWMFLEFFNFEELKIYAAIPFLIGILIICNYYLQAMFKRR